jgi:tetratricopeptide (TPR) repeat protein
MKMARKTTLFALLAFLAAPVSAAEDDARALEQFQRVIEGMNQHSFEMIKETIDQTDLTNRVLGSQTLQADVADGFRGNFWSVVESGVMGGLPPSGSEVRAELISFAFEDGQGQACVRFSYPGYEYNFQVIDLRHDRRSRLKIVDWFDASRGQLFSAYLGEELLGIKPTKESTRKLLSISAPTDLQLFQATEILKAIRDRQAPRFFEIYDEFDEQLRREPLIAKHAVFSANLLKDSGRFVESLKIFVDVYADDPEYAFMLSDYYMIAQDYENAFNLLRRFEQNFAIEEGALPAKLSALALAIGKADEAERFALMATTNEPTLELGWWSLLRARAGVENYQGALEPLQRLEDDFGHRLDESKLRRDKFRAFAGLAKSQEFKDWRADRN